jgi:hypothetical protein
VPKEPSLPAVHLAGVERARYVVAVREAADRNGREIAAKKSPDAIPPVRGVEAVRGPAGRKDARAHELKKRKKAKKKDVVEKPSTPPDPEGRGKNIDLQA